MFYFSIILVVVASIAYHLAQKYTAPNANPVLVLLLTYAVAFVGSLGLFFIFPLKESFKIEAQRVGIPNIALGVAIIGIEIGWVLAYRAGWNINVGSLIANLLVAILLLPMGWLLFKEHLTPINALGVLLCIIGLMMVNAKTAPV
jgi:hypothetical protein